MGLLNTKTGNVRGVKLQFADRETGTWSSRKPVQGWVIYRKGEYMFNLNFDVEEYDVEISLSEESLLSILDAVREYYNDTGA